MILKPGQQLFMHTILNGKRDLTGCGLHGYSLVSVLFFKLVNPRAFFNFIFIYLFLNIYKTFLLLFQVIFCFFLYIIVERWRRKGGLHPSVR